MIDCIKLGMVTFKMGGVLIDCIKLGRFMFV